MTQEPKSPSPASQSGSTKGASTQRLLGQLGGIAQAVLAAIVRLGGNLLRSAGKFWWNTVLPIVQRQFPAPWDRRLSKPALTGIAVTLLSLIFWLTSTLSHPAVSALKPDASQPIADRTAPVARTETNLTPEQQLRLQEKLTQVTEPYGESLIAAVQPGVRQHLTLTLDDDWYRLSAESQDRLLRELWNRSRQLSIAQLELLDLEDQRVARSPVVGEQMLILRRTSPRAAIVPDPKPLPEPVPESVLEPDPELPAATTSESESPADAAAELLKS